MLKFKNSAKHLVTFSLFFIFALFYYRMITQLPNLRTGRSFANEIDLLESLIFAFISSVFMFILYIKKVFGDETALGGAVGISTIFFMPLLFLLIPSVRIVFYIIIASIRHFAM